MRVAIRPLALRSHGRDWRIVVDGAASTHRIRPACASDGVALRAGQYVIVADAQRDCPLYAGSLRFFDSPDAAVRAVREHGLASAQTAQRSNG